MPLAGWLQRNKRISFEVALAEAETKGHFLRFPGSYLKALQRSERKESRLVLSPSAAGSCARNGLLKLTEDYYADPADYWAMHVGTAVHASLEGSGDIEEMKLELMLKVPVNLPDGTAKLVEFPLAGTLDHYSQSQRRLTDYKTTSSFKQFDQKAKQQTDKEYPDPKHVTQLNLYRLMLESHNYPVDSIQLWYVQPISGAPRKVVSAPLMDLEDAYYTAVELAQPYVYALETGELPECTCQYKPKIDPNLCQSVTVWNVDRLKAVFAANAELEAA
jgi:hypothetical protein